MDLQHIFDIAIGIILALIAAITRTIWGKLNETENRLHNLEIELPKTYVGKSDFQKAFDQIDRKLDRISEKLDGKADK